MNGLKLTDMEVFTKEYANARQAVAEEYDAMHREMEDAKRNHITTLKQRVTLAAEKKQQLANAIEANKTLFEKPKTQVFNGIKIGYRKQLGEITWEDNDKTVELIKKHFPNMVETMLRTKTVPVKASLETLSAADLKRIACSVGNDSEEMVIKPMDANVDKLVEDLLRDDMKE